MGTIVAMGGGGFSMEPEPLLDDYVLSLARSAEPRVCFVPTASGDAESYRLAFFRAFAGKPCQPADLPLFERTGADLRAFVLAQDVIYVGGGSTANLLAVWRVHGLDELLREAHEEGAVLCGISAGMNCWFEASVTDSFGGMDPLRDGLGLLPGSACPHFDGEAGRRPAYHRLVAEGFPEGHAADNGAALHFRDGCLVEVVASRPHARAYRVERGPTGVVERPLPTRLLGPSPPALGAPAARARGSAKPESEEAHVESEGRDVGRTVDEIAAETGPTPAAAGGPGELAGGNLAGGPGEGGADDEVGAGGARPGPGQGEPSDSDGDGARHPQSPHGSGPEQR